MIMIYGAYGYTGELIAEQAKLAKLPVILSGRNSEKLKQVGGKFNYETVTLELNDTATLEKALKDIKLVIHCAGPFLYTAKQMALACIKSNTHYIDITGEYSVFDALHAMDTEAKNAGIMLLPGAGFDVVPSDCLVGQLKALMPDGNKLELAFASKGASLSRGTAKTMVENIHTGHLYRKNGKIESNKLGSRTQLINYGNFEQISVGISWGDISTAYYSANIPNIEIFTGTTQDQIKKMKWAQIFSGMLKWRWVKNILLNKIDKKITGPSETKRKNSQTFFWGKISNDTESNELRLTTPNGYTLTALTTINIAHKIANGDFKVGYMTPAMAYGKDLILEIDGCKLD